MKQTCILVLGMHRSGTSALTGTLNMLDVYLGSELMKANIANEKGYFENNILYRINEKLLSQINSSWDDLFYDEEKLEHLKEVEELKQAITSEFRYANIFAIKDPRLAFLFPVYKKVLEELDIDIKIILPYRNPIEVANSLNKRDSMSLEKGMLLWAYHFLLAEKFSREYDRVFIGFDELISDTSKVIDKISSKLSIDFNEKYTQNKEQIDDFLEPSLKHNNISMENIFTNAPKIVRDILILKDNFNDTNITKEFDILIDELFSYQKLFYNNDIISSLDEGKRTKEKLNIKEEELNQRNDELKSKEEELKHIKESLEQKSEELSKVKQQQIDKLQEELVGIYTSKSWRLTKPLRDLVRVAKTSNKSTKQIFSLSKNLLFNLAKLIRHMNQHNLNKFIQHIKKGNFSFINEKINFYTNNEIKSIELDLIQDVIDYKIIEFKKVEKPQVSIIIPVYNQFEYTYKCLQSILKYTDEIDYEIIIADDVSTDQTIEISKIVKNIIVVKNEKNLGFLLNCNNAAKEAKGKYIHFLNNDTQVQPKWLSSLVDLIESDAKIGMVGSKLVYPDGRLQEAGGIVWNDASGWNFGRLDDPEKPEYNYVKEVDYISGASIMLSNELWNKIGGFDEIYIPAYYEDSDLAFEVRKHGYKVMFQPKSIIVHFEGISNGTDLGSGIKQYQVVNKEKFIEKWKEELENNHFPNAQDVFFARDRSKNKKQILVIDHYVPHYDQDAGSRTMWQYLKLFAELDYKVVFLGDNFYKHEPYTSDLQDIGIEVLYGQQIASSYENWFKENGNYFHSIYLLRPHISKKYIDLIKKYAKQPKLIYNGTDFHFLRLEREYELTKDKKILLEAKKIKEMEYKIFNAVDLVITISEYEKEFFQKTFVNKEIEVIPTFIYDEEFPLTKNNCFIDRKGLIFVGGFSHTPNYVGIKWFLENMWNDVKEKMPDIELYIVGSKTPEDIKLYEQKDTNIHVLGFLSDEDLNELYNKIRVVIAPLTFGAGVKGKIIESIANGLPVVTTPVGAEGIIDSDGILMVSSDETEFVNNVCKVYQNEDVWNKIRENQIDYSSKRLSYNATKELIEQIF